MELRADTFFCAAAFAHVAIDAALQADLVGRVDVDGELVQGQEFGVVQGEDAFNDDDAFRHHGFEGVRYAGVGFEVVHRTLYGAALREIPDVRDEEFAFERIRVVEVAFVAAVKRES